MNITRYTHIVWDWNGTLLDDVWLGVEIINQLLQERGKAPISRERYRAIFDFPVREYYRRAGFDFANETFENVGSRFIERYNRRVSDCHLQAGATGILRKNHRSGIRQTILSARESEGLRRDVQAFGIAEYIDEMIGLDHHYAHGKEDLAAGWLRTRGLSPSGMLLIGDTVHDFQVARQLGMDCILVSHGHQEEERLRKTGAAIYPSLAELAHVR